MTSATVNAYEAEPTTDALRAACETVCDLNRQIGDKYEEIGDLSCRRGLALQAIFESQGRAMIARGQQSMIVRFGDVAFKIKAGVEHPPMCACHGAFLSDCDTLGTVTTLPGPERPFVRVEPVEAKVKPC